MKFLSYAYSDETCSFTPIRLKGINLFVGATGSGKTRLFTTIFGMCGAIVKGESGAPGNWDLTFENEGKQYHYVYSVGRNEAGTTFVAAEQLERIEEGKEPEILIKRDAENTYFRNALLPKLQKSAPAVSILREEEQIQPVINGFALLVRRNFFADELTRAAQVAELSPESAASIDRTKTLQTAFLTFPLSVTLSMLERSFKSKFAEIQRTFKELFPFVTELEIRQANRFPQYISLPSSVSVVAIKENGISEWTPIDALSSGMLKVLLILTDLSVLPAGTVYMIDEYENSLGVNAIDFLPPLLLEHEAGIQFLLISHHPYLINNIPVKDWFVFGRHGKEVRIKYGDELKQRYGVSKQQIFTQLVNDPFYLEGRV